MDFEDNALNDELLALEAIYIDELCISRDENGHACDIRSVLHPATGNERERQYVRITLVIKPPVTYPNDLPQIVIENSRGLSDLQLSSLTQALYMHAERFQGEPMLYELIETAKDALTEDNIPHCPCPICLDHFTEEDNIWKTECYHYYHQECLLDYVTHCRRTAEEKDSAQSHKDDISCPICREIVDVKDIDKARPKRATKSRQGVRYTPSAEVVALQKKMQDLYMKQKEKGGIIDMNAEKNKFLLPNDYTPIAPTTRSGATTSGRAPKPSQRDKKPTFVHSKKSFDNRRRKFDGSKSADLTHSGASSKSESDQDYERRRALNSQRRSRQRAAHSENAGFDQGYKNSDKLEGKSEWRASFESNSVVSTESKDTHGRQAARTETRKREENGTEDPKLGETRNESANSFRRRARKKEDGAGKDMSDATKSRNDSTDYDRRRRRYEDRPDSQSFKARNTGWDRNGDIVPRPYSGRGRGQFPRRSDMESRNDAIPNEERGSRGRGRVLRGARGRGGRGRGTSQTLVEQGAGS